MRTVKHKIKPLSTKQEVHLLALMRAYQFEKNYWSDQLLARRSVAANRDNTDEINLKNLYTYKQIRDSKNLTKGNYHSKYHLPVRYCTIALKEAYDLHIRTYEGQIAFLKREINNKIYQFKLSEGIAVPTKAGLATPPAILLSKDMAAKQEELAITDASPSLLNTLKEFLYFATNSLFYNYKTFRTFEENFYSKKFRKARIYQRIQSILQDLLSEAKAVKKEVLTKEQAKEISNLLKLATPSGNKAYFITINQNNERSTCNCKCELELLNYYYNFLVKAIA